MHHGERGMVLRTLGRVVLPLIALVCLAVGAAAQPRSLTVAVLPFVEGGSLNLSWNSKHELLQGLAQMVSDRLANDPALTVVERARLEEVLEEQDLQSSGYVDPSTAVELGRLIGADILVMGSLNEFGWKNTGYIGVWPFHVQGATAKVVLSGRLVAVQTGQILSSLQGAGEKTGVSFSMSWFLGVSFGSSDFSNSIIGQALSAATDDFVGQLKPALANAQSRLASGTMAGVVGQVVALRDGFAIINIGTAGGIAERKRLAVYRLEYIEGIRDPVRIPVGTLQVVSADPNACVAKVLSLEGNSAVQVGDWVELLP